MHNSLFTTTLISHLLIGLFFVFSGFRNVYQWAPIMAMMNKDNIPHPYLILPICILCQVIAGFMIIFDFYSPTAALILLPFTVVSLFIFHPFWRYHGEVRNLHFTIFFTDMTVTLGALFFLI